MGGEAARGRRPQVIVVGAQIRAGRALLGWSRKELAKRACLHINSVGYWESTPEIKGRPMACERMKEALRAEGVVFFSRPAPGAYLRVESPIIEGSPAPPPPWGITIALQKSRRDLRQAQAPHGERSCAFQLWCANPQRRFLQAKTTQERQMPISRRKVYGAEDDGWAQTDCGCSKASLGKMAWE
jgi:hypothetical protein